MEPIAGALRQLRDRTCASGLSCGWGSWTSRTTLPWTSSPCEEDTSKGATAEKKPALTESDPCSSLNECRADAGVLLLNLLGVLGARDVLSVFFSTREERE